MVDVSVLPRRLIANVAGGLAVIYLWILWHAWPAYIGHPSHPGSRGVLLLGPLIAFIPSLAAAVQVYRTSEQRRGRTFAGWSLGLAVLGTIGWFGLLYALDRGAL